MKHNMLKPFFFVAMLVLTVSLACGIDFGTQTAEPVPTPIIQPSSQVVPSPAEVQPSPVPPTSQAEQFFTEEFNGASGSPLTGSSSCAPQATCPSSVMQNWNYFIVKGADEAKESGLSLKVASGFLTLDINSRFLYTYLVYTAQTYQNVTVEVRAENRGVNNNNVSLICRYSPTEGWYEFNIANNGLYNIYAVTFTSKGKVVYNYLTNGGSNNIKQGKDVNEYKITCQDRTLSLYINGDETNTFTDNKYVLREGQIGFSVSSFNVLPAKVDVDWIKVSQP
jgi:hypothetical protein